MAERVTEQGFRKRPQKFRQILAGNIKPHPLNFRRHGDRQKTALSAALEEVGFVGCCLVRPVGDDQFELIDGHERWSRFSAEETVPCLVIDVDEADANKILASHDQITALAEVDAELLSELTAGIEFETEGLQNLINSALVDAEDAIAASEPDDSAEGDETDGDGQQGEGKNTFQITVSCDDADHQLELLNQFKAQGLQCRATTS